MRLLVTLIVIKKRPNILIWVFEDRRATSAALL